MRWIAAIVIAVVALYALTLILRWRSAQDAADRAAQLHMADEQARTTVTAAKWGMAGGIAQGAGSAISGIGSIFARAFR